MTRIRSGLLALASLAVLSSQSAAAADNCLHEADVAALYIYAMPSAIDAARNSCDQSLQPGGFFQTGGPRLIAKYAALKGSTWPQAKQALLYLASSYKPGQGNPDIPDIDTVRLLASMPDDVARPLVDALVVEKVAEKVKPANCSKIERAAQAIAPIEPRDAAVLVSTILGIVAPKDSEICTVEP